MTVSALTPEHIAEKRRIAKAATKGPWRLGPPNREERGFVDVNAKTHHILARVVWVMEDDDLANVASPECEANAAHIADNDPPSVVAMLDAIEAQRDRADRAEAAIERMAEERDEARAERDSATLALASAFAQRDAALSEAKALRDAAFVTRNALWALVFVGAHEGRKSREERVANGRTALSAIDAALSSAADKGGEGHG